MNTLPKFSEKKATEAAIILLKLAGGRMKYIRLLKLLYLSDRKALAELGRSITNDRYCSMKYGQVPSRAYNLVKGTASLTEGVWIKYINSPVDQNYIELKITSDTLQALSESEIDIICSIYMEYVDKSDFDLADITKGAEYVQITGAKKSIDTPIEKILEALNYDDKQIEQIKEHLIEEAEIQAFFER